MKQILTFLLCTLIFLGATSCENKHDNDDLAGLWQLREWTDENGNKVTPDGRIFYAVQLGLIQFEAFFSDQVANYITMYATFQHNGNELILTNCYNPSSGGITDERQEDFRTLARYGVGTEGRFLILSISDNTLVLQGSKGTLYFRKY